MLRGMLLLMGIATASLMLVPGMGALDAELSRDPSASIAEEGLNWFVPDRAQAGHPVHAAVAVLEGDGFATSMHQDLSIWVTLDDEVLFHTENVHEHQGLHLLTVTPRQPGVLTFWADDGEGHGDHNGTWPATAGFGTASPSPGGMMAEVQVEGPVPSASSLPRLGPELEWTESAGWTLQTENATVPTQPMLTVADDQGRLVFNGWIHGANDDGNQVSLSGVAGDQIARALFAPHPGAVATPFTEEREARAQGPEDPVPAPGLSEPGDLMVPSCDEAPGRLVLDPNSIAPMEVVPAFQEWSDLRVHYLHPDRVASSDPGVLRYTLNEWPPSPGSYSVTAQTDHPQGYMALRPPGPGMYRLVVSEGGPEGFTDVCFMRFQVLPEPMGMEAGSLGVELEVGNASLTADLVSLGADGAALPHYEFDVHVHRLADEEPAWLAWRGKLHGHGGEVSFHLDQLVAGEYEMRVYPSPQDAGLPPLAADADAFVYPFDVEAEETDGPDQDPDEEAELLPGPFVPALVVFIVAWAGLGRFVSRRRA